MSVVNHADSVRYEAGATVEHQVIDRAGAGNVFDCLYGERGLIRSEDSVAFFERRGLEGNSFASYDGMAGCEFDQAVDADPRFIGCDRDLSHLVRFEPVTGLHEAKNGVAGFKLADAFGLTVWQRYLGVAGEAVIWGT